MILMFIGTFIKYLQYDLQCDAFQSYSKYYATIPATYLANRKRQFSTIWKRYRRYFATDFFRLIFQWVLTLLKLANTTSTRRAGGFSNERKTKRN